MCRKCCVTTNFCSSLIDIQSNIQLLEVNTRKKINQEMASDVDFTASKNGECTLCEVEFFLRSKLSKNANKSFP